MSQVLAFAMNTTSPLSTSLQDPSLHPARSYLPSLHPLDLSCQSEAMAGGKRGTYVAAISTDQRAWSDILPFQTTEDLPVVNTKVMCDTLCFELYQMYKSEESWFWLML